MKSSGKRLIPVGLSIAVAVLWLATPVFGASITGTNPVLTASGGSLFIPLTPAASGTLATGGPGWSSDSATVSGVGGTSSGFVSFVLSFDLSSELGPGEIVEPITSNLVLTFDDMDFKPDPIGPTLLQEIMALTFLRDATDAPGAVDLVMNNLNYGLYRPDGFGETDNTTVSYLLNMLLDLGLSNADFDDMNADKEFGLYVTFSSALTMTQDGSVTVTNTSENIGNSFGFVVIPEPATVSLLGLGGLVLSLRRRKLGARRN